MLGTFGWMQQRNYQYYQQQQNQQFIQVIGPQYKQMMDWFASQGTPPVVKDQQLNAWLQSIMGGYREMRTTQYGQQTTGRYVKYQGSLDQLKRELSQAAVQQAQDAEKQKFATEFRTLYEKLIKIRGYQQLLQKENIQQWSLSNVYQNSRSNIRNVNLSQLKDWIPRIKKIVDENDPEMIAKRKAEEKAKAEAEAKKKAEEEKKKKEAEEAKRKEEAAKKKVEEEKQAAEARRQVLIQKGLIARPAGWGMKKPEKKLPTATATIKPKVAAKKAAKPAAKGAGIMRPRRCPRGVKPTIPSNWNDAAASKRYLDKYKDVAAAVRGGAVRSALFHYACQGAKEGRTWAGWGRPGYLGGIFANWDQDDD